MSALDRDYLIGRWRYTVGRMVRRIWFRASMFSLAAVIIALLSAFLVRFVTFPFELTLASEAVDNILTILASSMLAVTTFSLSIMVSAYAAAASTSTPRATELLISDSVASNTLATFIGSFLFAVVGMIGMSMGIYGNQGRVLLFFSTLIVLFLVTAALLRWIEQLTHFGRVGDTIWRVEQASEAAARSWAKLPRLGAAAEEDVPEGAAPLYLEEMGYIQHLDMEELNKLARRSGGTVHVRKLPGAYIGPHIAVAFLEAEPDGEMREAMAECFTIDRQRSFGQDPSFGLIVLSEIASRALSPAVNDPGTAIQVLTAGTRVLQAYCESLNERTEARFECVRAPDIDHGEMLEDFFNPIARDGASLLEVQHRLQRSLHMVALANRDLFAEAAGRISAVSLKRALNHLDANLEKTRLRRVAGWSLPDEYTGELTDEEARRAEA